MYINIKVKLKHVWQKLTSDNFQKMSFVFFNLFTTNLLPEKNLGLFLIIFDNI